MKYGVQCADGWRGEPLWDTREPALEIIESLIAHPGSCVCDGPHLIVEYPTDGE